MKYLVFLILIFTCCGIDTNPTQYKKCTKEQYLLIDDFIKRCNDSNLHGSCFHRAILMYCDDKEVSDLED